MEELDNLDTIRIALMTEVAQVLMETFESGKFQMIGPDDDGNGGLTSSTSSAVRKVLLGSRMLG